MDHGPPQVFSAGLSPVVAHCNIVRDAVVFDKGRVIHRNICGSLLEVAGGISASLHYISEEPVSFRDRCLRIVHELRLYPDPTVGIADAVRFRQRPNVKLLPPLLAKFQNPFAAADVAFTFYYSLVLRTEALAQQSCPSLAGVEEAQNNSTR